jgi:flagellar hook assembly protein FlgD
MTVAVPKAAMVEIVVYNILGQKVRTLVNEVKPAGYHTIEWNGKSDVGSIVPSGVYFMRMVSGSFTKVNKLLMLK